jgi:hypothetical protein
VSQDQGSDDSIVEGAEQGMNSGMRSIGDANQSAPKMSSTFEPRGTRGSAELRSFRMA